MLRKIEKTSIIWLRLAIHIATICGVGKIGAIYGCNWQVLIAAIGVLFIDFIVWRVQETTLRDLEDEDEDLID